MRLLWLAHFVPFPPRGGNLQRSHNLLRWAASRHEVHLVALTQRAILPSDEDLADAKNALQPWLATMTVFDIPSDRSRARWWALAARAFFDPRPYEEVWLAQPAVHQAVTAVGRRVGGFDLVHADTLGMAQYFASAPGSATVVNHHNVESHITERRAQRDRNMFRRAYLARDAAKLRVSERRVCPLVSLNITVSALDAERLRVVAPGAVVEVVENGVDTEFFRPSGADPAPGTILFVASMTWYPNAEAARYLIREIWPRLRMSDPDARLKVVGPGPPAELVHLAQNDDRFSAPGLVDDVRPYFDEAEIYLCPIRDGGGTRLKILDALAMAKPMVATSVAVEGLGLEDGVHFLLAETPEAFVEQVGRLRREPTLRQRLGAAGREVVEARYAWSVVGLHLESAYSRALARTQLERPRVA